MIERAIEIGEHSGRLNEEAFRAAELYEAKTVRNIGLFAKWMPIFIYLAILGLFAYLIVGQAMQAYQPINSPSRGIVSKWRFSGAIGESLICAIMAQC